MQSITLSELALGECAKVSALSLCGPLRQRMIDLGLSEGSRVQAVLKGTTGNLVAYYMRGALIALRQSDAQNILVTPLPKQEAVKC